MRNILLVIVPLFLLQTLSACDSGKKFQPGDGEETDGVDIDAADETTLEDALETVDVEAPEEAVEIVDGQEAGDPPPEGDLVEEDAVEEDPAEEDPAEEDLAEEDLAEEDPAAEECVSVCGNGIVECAEECDDGSANSDTASDACRTDCTDPGCGDGVIDYGLSEQCDDGGTASGDGCDSSCQIEPPPTCGDGNVDYGNGEQCDDGNTIDGDGCSAACLIEAPPTCGDGVLDIAGGEQCDDGNTVGGDGCSPTCQFEIVGDDCGDGTIGGLEICDDGNVLNGDSCNPTCNLENMTSLFVGLPGNQGLVDGVGTAARLGGFGTLTVDDVYLYYGDGHNNVVRRIEIATATVQTIAGDAAGGSAGYVDDPVGTNARFLWVEAVATDGTTLWVADVGRIRAVDLSPPFPVTTVAGSGVQNHTDGFGTAAEFDDLRGLTYYGGYVYLLDANAATLRRFDPVSTEVVTLAGAAYVTGQTDGFGSAARFISPRYIASDNSGMLYISDTNGNKIRAYNTVTTEVTTFAGDGTSGYVDGTGTAARIHRPRGMTSDGTSIYWSEFDMYTIRQGTLATTDVTTLVGTPGTIGYLEGVGSAAVLDHPVGLVFHYPSNSLFFVDSGNYVIRRIQ